MSITPNKEILLKTPQILEIEYIVVGICGNCGKPLAEKNTLDALEEKEIKKTWVTCPHCDYENTVLGLSYN